MSVEGRGWATRVGIDLANWQQEEPTDFDGRRQLSRGGTSRVSREAQARICERLGVKLPGPTRRPVPPPRCGPYPCGGGRRPGAAARLSAGRGPPMPGAPARGPPGRSGCAPADGTHARRSVAGCGLLLGNLADGARFPLVHPPDQPATARNKDRAGTIGRLRRPPKGDTSIEVRTGTFLKRLDIAEDLP